MKQWTTLKNTKEFQQVYNTRKSSANRYLIMYVRENQQGNRRIGISVSKKVGNSVVRHRVTRLIREAYRLNISKIKSDYDIVVVARNTVKDAGYAEVESAFMHLVKLHRIGIGK